MIRERWQKFKERNYFDSSSNNSVSSNDLIKILKGQVLRQTFFIVCQNGINQINREGEIRVGEIEDVIDSVLNKSEWFGKFYPTGSSKIIVPGRYDLPINIKEEKLWLSEEENARYYGIGTLQLDKDSRLRLLRTKVSFEELKDLINENCSEYTGGKTLDKWKE